ncbi:HAD family hydrolase [Donghicola sp. C2-DW-16]|uniref:HAD family hydrolase n=1 Tax=Donghicola mangrovi TaxID=2729614 RepID=A0ABX2P9A3_9RHOB|nr:HAD family hydrolase [Donghicola mangrovi]NVO26040.1 HAD family hydrolase [Donghicola mangrovi]
MRLAVWSGPRNLSTAMMYSFGHRQDFTAVDEPFYAAYLAMTGLQHPMRDEVIASQPTDPDQVVQGLLGHTERPHVYHKHMAQHMIDGVPRDFIHQCTNVFLLRHPARVVASFSAKFDQPTLADIGFVQQHELYQALTAQGIAPVVIDSADIRQAPEAALRALCDAIGLEFDPAMLSWPKGAHPDDGVWATHWYGSVHNSTGFAGAEGPMPDVPQELQHLVDGAMPHYLAMREKLLSVT